MNLTIVEFKDAQKTPVLVQSSDMNLTIVEFKVEL